VYVGGHRRGVIVPLRRGKLGGFSGVLGFESRDVGSNIVLVPVSLEKPGHPLAGVAEQPPVDELDRGSRAFDVQQDRADPLQRDTVRSGM
jgi:hypothetical protein